MRFGWKTYHQRSKENMVSALIKRIFGDCVMSRQIVTQNREMMYRDMIVFTAQSSNSSDKLLVLIINF